MVLSTSATLNFCSTFTSVSYFTSERRSVVVELEVEGSATAVERREDVVFVAWIGLVNADAVWVRRNTDRMLLESFILSILIILARKQCIFYEG